MFAKQEALLFTNYLPYITSLYQDNVVPTDVSDAFTDVLIKLAVFKLRIVPSIMLLEYDITRQLPPIQYDDE